MVPDLRLLPLATPVPSVEAGRASPRPGARVAIATLGCKLNQADSDRLAERFAAAGYVVVAPNDTADVFVLNTCTVTHVADRKARQSLRAVRRRLPAALIVATGCYPQRDPDAIAALPDVDIIAGNDRKRELVEIVGNALGGSLSPYGEREIPHVSEVRVRAGAVTPAPGNTRVFLAIQEGCNDVCTYCIVPRVRGRSRSVPAMTLVDQVQAAVEAGAQEVVLTGTQLGDYGLDDPRPRRPGWSPPDGSRDLLAKLLTRILSETAVERLRVSSLQPQDFTPALLAVWRDPRLCPHLHLPLQSGSDRILAAMRRRYGRDAYLRAIAAARAAIPGVAITTDVIVGFPGEMDADVAATLELCRMAGFAALHVFPYSPRTGTAAARLPDRVPDEVRRTRVEQALALGRQLSEDYRHGLTGSRVDVLWERPVVQDGIQVATGLTGTHVRVYAKSANGPQGTVSTVKVERLHGDGVWGTAP